jgi:hypothetical protein
MKVQEQNEVSHLFLKKLFIQQRWSLTVLMQPCTHKEMFGKYIILNTHLLRMYRVGPSIFS